MLNIIFGTSTKLRLRAASGTAVSVAALACTLSVAAQLPTLDVSKQASQTSTPAPKNDPSNISSKPPDIPVPEIIKKFGDRELEFKKERDNYTYTQTFVVQTIDFDGRPDGEYRMTSDILFTPEGKRYEKVISAPPPTLQRISLSQQDLDDLEHVQPFVLTSDEISNTTSPTAAEKTRRVNRLCLRCRAPEKMKKISAIFRAASGWTTKNSIS